MISDDERVDGVLENELVRLRQEQRADVERWNQANTEAQALIRTLEHALAESVKLQAHYAALLNMHDGGQRRIFSTVESWLARLQEIA